MTIKQRSRSIFPSGTVLPRQAVITLTDAQIKALPSAAVDLVPAVGAGKIIVPVAATAIVNTSAGAYVATVGASWMLMWEGGVYVSSPQNIQSTLQAVASSFVLIPAPPMQLDAADFGASTVIGNGQSGTLANITNKALQIKDDWNGVPDYTGGDIANSAVISVTYLVLNTVTGRFE